MARDALVEGLAAAPLGVTVPGQGLHLVALAPAGAQDGDLQRRAQARGLATRRLSEMFIAAPARQGLVIGFSGFAPAEIGAAARRAAAAIAAGEARG
jgi:GntR family transcriptional regulator/MocR family aminotransferase